MSTCNTLAGRPTAAASSAPRATSPAAVPADEPSTNAGKTLLVPVEIGDDRRVRPADRDVAARAVAAEDDDRHAARARPAASAPRGCRAPNRCRHRRRARRRRCRRRARSAMRPVSRATTTRSAPASSAADRDPPHDADFAVSGRLADGRVQRRTSLPAHGLTMMPTAGHAPVTAPSSGRASASRTPAAMSRGVGHVLALERRRERHRRERRADPTDRRVEVVERLLLDLRRHLGAEAAEAHRLVGDDDPVGLAHRLDDRVDVERRQRAQVDHLGVDAVGGQLLGGGERCRRRSCPTTRSSRRCPAASTLATPSGTW